MAHVAKDVVVLPHLGYESSYNLYLFSLCADLSRLTEIEILVKIPTDANTQTEEELRLQWEISVILQGS